MNALERKMLLEKEFEGRFGTRPRVWVQAPGRVDLMGSHTDYNLGYVLTEAIDRNTWIVSTPRTDGKVRIESLNVKGGAEFSLTAVDHDREHPWTDYVRGVADVLQKAGYKLTGFDGLVHSTIPFGSGLSSSAALEVSTATLFEALGGWRMDSVQKALLCQKAENEFVGMNCGILDQYTSVMGQEGNVLLLDCRSITHEARPIAPGIQVMICDTRAERALTGSEYPERRAQCEEGVRILSGFYPEIQSLRDATLEQLEAHKLDLGSIVYKRCKFILQENERVLAIAGTLAKGKHTEAGHLAIQSFEGARDLYEIVSREMTAMFEAIMSAPGAFGTRGAGAGFGGCMVAFVRSDRIESFTQQVREQYIARTGIEPEIYPVWAAAGAGVLTI